MLQRMAQAGALRLQIHVCKSQCESSPRGGGGAGDTDALARHKAVAPAADEVPTAPAADVAVATTPNSKAAMLRRLAEAGALLLLFAHRLWLTGCADALARSNMRASNLSSASFEDDKAAMLKRLAQAGARAQLPRTGLTSHADAMTRERAPDAQQPPVAAAAVDDPAAKRVALLQRLAQAGTSAHGSRCALTLRLCRRHGARQPAALFRLARADGSRIEIGHAETPPGRRRARKNGAPANADDC